MNTKLIAFLCCLFLSACMAEHSPVQLPSKVVHVLDGQSILVRLDEGELVVRGSEDEAVHVDGQTLSTGQTEYRVTSSNDQVEVIASFTGSRFDNPPVRLEVSIPDDTPVKIETDSASILVRNYHGILEAESVSGDIFIEAVEGEIVARSNRGNVSVDDSTGKISVVGNYGLLTLAGSSGDVGVSTIMGSITFNGRVQSGDRVSLETDHGPVAVELSPDSAVSLQVSSTSGDVACMLPNVSSSLRGCNGKLNSGDGALTIRTVSGAVTLQLIP
jgi:sulfur carrier protein ThiS